ncbi:rhodanese-like domain-containing protein [Deferrisoma sp.]
MRSLRWLRYAAVALLFPLALGACGGSDDDDDNAGSPTPPVSTAITREDVAARLDGVLKTGLNTINADQVAALFFDGDPANDPFVLDVRSAEDYAKGHIPGAVNVPLKEFAQRYLEEGDALVPADKNVVVASYYGGDGNMASLLINAVRIKDPANVGDYPWSKTIMMGMMAWSFDKELSNGHRFTDDEGDKRLADGPVETTAHPGGSFELPEFSGFSADTVEGVILERAASYLAQADDPLTLQMPATELKALLDDGDPANDPQILSVRGAAHYALGHIPGALNVYWKDTAVLENLTILDPDKPVVAYCYTGHTGSLATLALAILGYDAKNLLYGMNGWHMSGAIAASQLANFDTIRGWDFPVDDGDDDLGSLAAYTPPTGCKGCHTSLTAIFYDLTRNPPQATEAPPSVGEG